MVVYAKSSLGNKKPETLREHTDILLENYGFLRINKFIKYNHKDIDTAIKAMLELHDYGKLNHKFQNKLPIDGKNDIFIKELDGYAEIPHAWLSLAFITEEMEDFWEDLGELFNTNLEFDYIIKYAISFHHNRNHIFNSENLTKFIKYDLEKRKEEIGIKYSLNDTYYIDKIKQKIESPKNFEAYLPYLVFFKGLLHKCDYSASAHLTPEKIYDGNYNKDFDNWLPFELKGFQKDAKTLSEQNKSVVLVASTGVGKTEYSMNWIGGSKTSNKKAFYLLGLRMATNKMSDRFKEVFNSNNRENVALLHSSVGSYEYNENEDIFSYFNKRSQAKQLSYPITIATADQLVTSVFKYSGFELKYFTASYSYIVVDEIQSFAPEAIASIIVFLQEIHKLGGRFLLMTATLPSFVKDDLKNLSDIEFPEHKDQLSDKKRHKVELIEEKIEENILDYIEDDKKILIICNTVKKAQEIAGILENKGVTPKLLHSKFIVKDRTKKENEIMNNAPNGKGGEKSVIWISTQIVEASLDIDFDLLLTENATIDSLLQRFGRCYRSRSLETPPLGGWEAKSIFLYLKMMKFQNLFMIKI